MILLWHKIRSISDVVIRYCTVIFRIETLLAELLGRRRQIWLPVVSKSNQGPINRMHLTEVAMPDSASLLVAWTSRSPSWKSMPVPAVDGGRIQDSSANSSANADGLINPWYQRQSDACNGCNTPAGILYYGSTQSRHSTTASVIWSSEIFSKAQSRRLLQREFINLIMQLCRYPGLPHLLGHHVNRHLL